MTRRIHPDERAAYARLLNALADELTGNHADSVQTLLTDALDYGYPSTSSTVPKQHTNRVDDDGHPLHPDTRPEQLALDPDRMAADAADLIRAVQRIARQAGHLAVRLQAWNPNRVVRRCGACGHPLPRGTSRCQRMIDGRRCSATETTERRCGNPHHNKIMAPGEKLRKGPDGIYRCNTCRMFHERNQRDRTTINSYGLGANVLMEQEATDA